MKRLPGPRFRTSSEIDVYLEPSDAIPLVDVEIVIADGCAWDRPERAGLTRLTCQLVRRGPHGMSGEDFDAAIEGLGATLGITVSSHSVRVHGAVIRRNLEPYLALVGRMLARPAMRASDLARLVRKGEAELVELRDHDRSLGARALRSHLFGDHPYGIPVNGTLETIATLRRKEILERYEALLTTPKIVGIAGDVDPDTLRPLLDRTLRDLPKGRRAVRRAFPAPELARGRRVLVVDKPERTQTQVYIGTLGAKVGERAYHPLVVANTAFGGTFTSRLVQKVRAERGWSYGAGSRLGADREREAWTMWTHPAIEQAVDCVALELSLLDAWVSKGITARELDRSRRYLVKSHAFDLETATKRLEPQLETALYDLPLDWHPRYTERVREVTRESAARAVRTHISPRDLSIAIVATATAPLVKALEALPGIRALERISFDQV